MPSAWKSNNMYIILHTNNPKRNTTIAKRNAKHDTQTSYDTMINHWSSLSQGLTTHNTASACFCLGFWREISRNQHSSGYSREHDNLNRISKSVREFTESRDSKHRPYAKLCAGSERAWGTLYNIPNRISQKTTIFLKLCEIKSYAHRCIRRYLTRESR